MIENVKGKLISKTPTTAIVEVGGVSLSIAISISTFDRLPDQDKEVSLKTYLNVREDALELYGFNSIVERSLFLMLIGISGIGPKMGINILSGTTAEEFLNSQNEKKLSDIIFKYGEERYSRKIAKAIIDYKKKKELRELWN